MIDDDLSLPQRVPGALASLVREDLTPYSVEELGSRIATLEAEIQRVRAAMDTKKNRLSEAQALFSFKDS